MLVSKHQIDNTLLLLHNNPIISTRPTVVPVYEPPHEFKREVFNEKYSQDIIQRLSDHIGYYLGLFNSVKVTIGIESSEHMLADVKTMDDVGKIGLYKASGSHQREIHLTKKFRFRLKHILAILIHESMHNYLYQKGIKEDNTEDNEILTDVSAAYLGLGHLLKNGYKPITWATNHWSNGFEYGHTEHKYTIGYIPYSKINYAIYRSAILREEKDFIRSLPIHWRSRIRYHFWKNNRKKIIYTREVDKLKSSLGHTLSTFDNIKIIIQSTPVDRWKENIPADTGKSFVDLFNAISIGEFQQNINDLLMQLTSLPNNANLDKIKYIKKEARVLHDMVSDWNQIVQLYRI